MDSVTTLLTVTCLWVHCCLLAEPYSAEDVTNIVAALISQSLRVLYMLYAASRTCSALMLTL